MVCKAYAMTDENKARLGRPEKAPEERSSARINLRAKHADVEELQRAAAEAGESLSQFMLTASARRAKRLLRRV